MWLEWFTFFSFVFVLFLRINRVGRRRKHPLLFDKRVLLIWIRCTKTHIFENVFLRHLCATATAYVRYTQTNSTRLWEMLLRKLKYIFWCCVRDRTHEKPPKWMWITSMILVLVFVFSLLIYSIMCHTLLHLCEASATTTNEK